MMQTSPRTRRLHNDRKALEQLQTDSTIFRIQASGEPADFYRLQFHGRGMARDAADKPVQPVQYHEVHMRLGANYPRSMPDLSWKTPIFHPNISASGFVCLGGYGTHWAPSVALDELCCMLWDMIRCENYDVASPYNREAAAWVLERGPQMFPLDKRPLRDRIATSVNSGEMAPLGRVEPIARQTAPSSPPSLPNVLAPALRTAWSSVRTGALERILHPPQASRPNVVSESGVMFLDEAIIDAELVEPQLSAATAGDGDIVFLN